MSELPEGPTRKSQIVRFVAVLGSLLFLGLALRMGMESWQARASGSRVSNWKGGTMTCQDGFKLTGVFVTFACFWIYAAITGKTK